MHTTSALICPRCGAPLPADAATSATVECEYCKTLIALGDRRATVQRAAIDPGAAAPTPRAFYQAVAEARFTADGAYEALCAVGRQHLGAMGQTDVMARVTLALADDFERESGIVVRDQSVVLSRIAEAYLKACDALRTAPQTELNLPYLVADGNGPRHLRRTLTPALVAELAARDPNARSAEKKKGWWPF